MTGRFIDFGRAMLWIFRLALTLPLIATVAPAFGVERAWSEGLDAPMFSDPRFEFPEIEMRFSPRPVPLWIAALRGQEADLKCQAATTITWCRRRGMQGLQDAIAPLMENLQDEHHLVRLAAAEALIALEAHAAAETLYACSQTGALDLAQLVEPTLGRWGHEPMIETWRQRLNDQPPPDHRRLLLAIRGLDELRDAAAGADLQQLATDISRPPTARLAAAKALGDMRREGLEELAAKQLEDEHVMERLIAARLVRWHTSERARELLVRLAQDDQSSVAAIALGGLVELDPDLVLPFAADALGKGDANVRRLVATALVARPSDTTLEMLGDLLGDPIPDLRVFVRQSLETLAGTPQWHAPIIAQGRRMLATDRWPALEQAMKLLIRLDDRSQTPRMMALLEHPRPEVYVTAAWAVRKSAVDETLESLLEFAEQRNENRVELMLQKNYLEGLDEQLSQILQFFGQKRYTPAEPFLRSFVPKNFEVYEARGAAVWALGHLYEDNPDPELVSELVDRLRDFEGMFPETGIVRRFAAVSLGRMQAQEALPDLERFREPTGIVSSIGYGCAWAIRELTGREFDPPAASFQYYTNFFLEPLRNEPQK
jgi:HEAT repeat protein